MRSRQDFEDYARDVTPGLLRRARLLCRDEHRAEDLVQESLARLYRGRRRIDEGRNPTGYAHTLLSNVFLEQARRRSSSELALADPVPPPSPDPTRPTRWTVACCSRQPCSGWASSSAWPWLPATSTTVRSRRSHS